jgi:hypothetical protein
VLSSGLKNHLGTQPIFIGNNPLRNSSLICATWPEHNDFGVSGVTKEHHGIGSSNKEHIQAEMEAGRPCLYAADACGIIN